MQVTSQCCHRDQVLGRNCRFLQGPLTDKAEVQRMRDAMTADPPRAVTVKLLNYKVNGQLFWNALHVAPIRNADGQVRHHMSMHRPACFQNTVCALYEHVVSKLKEQYTDTA